MVLVAAVIGTRMPHLAPLWVCTMALGVLLGLRGAKVPVTTAEYRGWRYFLTATVALSSVLTLRETLGGHPAVFVGGAIAATALALAAGEPRSPSRLSTAGFVGLLAIEAFGLIRLASFGDGAHIDVLVFLNEGSHRMVSGIDPYLPGYPNIYDPRVSPQLYGPGIVGPDNRLTVGLPYMPVTLVATVPAYLLGDARFAAVALILAASALMFWSGPVNARPAAILLAYAPGLGQMVLNGWTETMIVAGFAFAVVAARCRRWLLAAALLGVAFASKQYFVVAVPCLWLLRPYATRQRIAAFVTVPLVVTLPFLLWHPRAFWRSIVEFQLLQPLREDSLSFLTWSVSEFGWSGFTAAAPLSLGAGVACAAVLAWRSRPGADTFLLATGVSLFVTTALSKQAFLNYYFLVGGLLLLSGWARAAARGSEEASLPHHDGFTEPSAPTIDGRSGTSLTFAANR
ncbi:hypothetical protein [Knoellia koreensis]|uniref:DUF2029 domain-containing protein n=1 Tax=Knoellia koreensis TaxID=2730921 RepID=A0A849HGM8_9MICO|nr:hypothetical protein [Knoellia sp. DB2414S]NNM46349.1 hypothetical protein [Knoellia sp. DB2414S]